MSGLMRRLSAPICAADASVYSLFLRLHRVFDGLMLMALAGGGLSGNRHPEAALGLRVAAGVHKKKTKPMRGVRGRMACRPVLRLS
ncbi:hypothetical protein [Azospirillum sp. TSO22-1]|uniref:hypothetical protein n=1 Tax=Azospirillum sp. TSO22-1 TaxID=716789 RepID=UPI0011B5D813|nr:hypothetical protein [Azospirillum sp. TSO22-1]